MDQQQEAVPVTFKWPPLESSPEVFTEYLQKIGMSKEWAVGEVFGFDEDLLAFLPSPQVGVIVAFESLKKGEESGSEDNIPIVPYYMKQHGQLDNACGIIACLHSLLNNLDQISLEEGSILERFNIATLGKTPAEKATLLENNVEFQNEHKSYAGQGQTEVPDQQSGVKHHFIAFVVNKDKQLVELDGCKKGPNVIAEGCEDVLRGTIAEIQRRLAAEEISHSVNMMTLNAAS